MLAKHTTWKLGWNPKVHLKNMKLVLIKKKKRYARLVTLYLKMIHNCLVILTLGTDSYMLS